MTPEPRRLELAPLAQKIVIKAGQANELRLAPAMANREGLGGAAIMLKTAEQIAQGRWRRGWDSAYDRLSC